MAIPSSAAKLRAGAAVLGEIEESAATRPEAFPKGRHRKAPKGAPLATAGATALSRKPGSLFEELGYVGEEKAARAIDLMPATLIAYRKRGIGPPHTIVGRRILYNIDRLAEWLADGGLAKPNRRPARSRAPAARCLEV